MKPAPPTLPVGYKVKREKNRWSFTKAEWNWQVDLTEVITHLPDDSEPARINYEIEFEFDEDVIRLCRNADKPSLKTVSTKFWEFAIKLLNLLYKSNESHFDKSLCLHKVCTCLELCANIPFFRWFMALTLTDHWWKWASWFTGDVHLMDTRNIHRQTGWVSWLYACQSDKRASPRTTT